LIWPNVLFASFVVYSMHREATLPSMMPLQSDLGRCAEEEVLWDVQNCRSSSDNENEEYPSFCLSREDASQSSRDSTKDDEDVNLDKPMGQAASREKTQEVVEDKFGLFFGRCASDNVGAKELVKAFWSHMMELQRANAALEKKVSDITMASQVEKHALAAQLALIQKENHSLQLDRDSMKVQLNTSNSKLRDASMKQVRADNAALAMKHEFHEKVKQLQADSETAVEALQAELKDACWKKIRDDNAALSLKYELVEQIRMVRSDSTRELADVMQQLQSDRETINYLTTHNSAVCIESRRIKARLQSKCDDILKLQLQCQDTEKALSLAEAARNDVQKELLKLKAAASNSSSLSNSGVVGGVRFQYECAPGQWESMAPDKSNDVLKKYIDYTRSGLHDDMTYEAAGNSYEVSFSRMTQRNIATRKERKIRYKFSIPADWSSSDLKLMTIKLSKAPISYNDCIVEIHDTSRLQLFTELLKSSVHHHHSLPSHASGSCSTSGLMVKKAWKVENLALRQVYENCKMDMVEQLRSVSLQKIDPPLVESLASFGKECHVDPDINEAILFHGTKAELCKKIVTEGFDDRLSREGFYGMGTYFASQACKSMQYASGLNKVILVSRVLLGDPHFATEVSGQNQKMRRPPERNSRVCDSIIARPGSMPGHSARFQSHQEFVIFERAQAYPEYILYL